MTTLLVANDGGHLAQLHLLAGRLPFTSAPRWVTTPTPQSESLLAGHDVHWVKPAPTRDLKAVLANTALIAPLFRRKVEAVVSTGSSLALSCIPMARAHGCDAHYIESATRTQGPSLSGRILQRVPGVKLYTQNLEWASPRWAYPGSVFDGWTAVLAEQTAPVRRAVVSLGTSRTYGFRRMLETLAPMLHEAGVEVLWQTGCTDTTGLPMTRPRVAVPAVELAAAIGDSDVVIAHAGTGVALESLRAGKLPLLVPRRGAFAEHVDDHQEQIARMLADRGLAVVREADALSFEDLEIAAAHRITLRSDVRPLALHGHRIDITSTDSHVEV